MRASYGSGGLVWSLRAPALGVFMSALVLFLCVYMDWSCIILYFSYYRFPLGNGCVSWDWWASAGPLYLINRTQSDGVPWADAEEQRLLSRARIVRASAQMALFRSAMPRFKPQGLLSIASHPSCFPWPEETRAGTNSRAMSETERDLLYVVGYHKSNASTKRQAMTSFQSLCKTVLPHHSES